MKRHLIICFTVCILLVFCLVCSYEYSEEYGKLIMLKSDYDTVREVRAGGYSLSLDAESQRTAADALSYLRKAGAAFSGFAGDKILSALEDNISELLGFIGNVIYDNAEYEYSGACEA